MSDTYPREVAREGSPSRRNDMNRIVLWCVCSAALASTDVNLEQSRAREISMLSDVSGEILATHERLIAEDEGKKIGPPPVRLSADFEGGIGRAIG